MIVNKGNRRLIIHEVAGSCRCGESPAKMILTPPGDTGRLIVRFDAGRSTGPVEVVRSFTTNDAARPTFDLTIRTRVLDRAKTGVQSVLRSVQL